MTKQLLEQGARVLLIDIDDTLILQEPASKKQRGYRLLALIQEAAMQAGVEHDIVESVFDRVLESVWWRWGDFLDALAIDPDVFWPWADEAESLRTQPTAPDLPEIFYRLHHAGYRLVITSNNPTDGIAHKLRQVGIDNPTQRRLLHATYGTNNTQANKTLPRFWQHVIDDLGVPPTSLTVIGDNPYDDQFVPNSLGIHHTILFSAVSSKAHDWDMIQDILLDDPQEAVAKR